MPLPAVCAVCLSVHQPGPLFLGCCVIAFLLCLQMSPDCKVIILPKEEVDKANKDKKKHYPPNFQVSRCTLRARHATPLIVGALG